ncbi:MAG: polysulfide reductase NrfD [Ignavibacteriae bacterium]|nr:polysulfide reductase NrfD [Ignavibacteriota bacterium]
MNEFTTTRSNHLVDPVMHIYGWEIAVYLFLGGLVAGMMIVSGYFLYRGREKEDTCSCLYLPTLGIILLSIGMFALFLDLDYKVHVWRMYTTFQIASPMSWGAWILILVYPALILNMIIRLPWYLPTKLKFLFTWSEKLNSNPNYVKAVGIINMVLGIMLGVYTGILLSSFGARPLWNSAILGLLFLVSGLSTASALVHLITKNKEESITLAKADNGFLMAELVILFLFIIGLLSSTQVHINAADIILSGAYAPAFWVFVVGLGIVIPLIIQSLAVRHKIKHTPVAPIMVIAGGLVLRFVIVYAGQLSHWTKKAFLE